MRHTRAADAGDAHRGAQPDDWPAGCLSGPTTMVPSELARFVSAFQLIFQAQPGTYLLTSHRWEG